jgi:polyphosphate kinase 2 (PPK2 family)
MDAAGKDDAIRHVRSDANPQVCQVLSFKHSGGVVSEHNFLWRTECGLPELWQIGLFNPSRHEEAGILRMHRELLSAEALLDPPSDERTFRRHRYRSIAELERHLHVNGMRVVKFVLRLSKEEQCKRFLSRLDEPDKNLKISAADTKKNDLRKQYTKACEECLGATGAGDVARRVVPVDHKDNSRLIVPQIVPDTFEDIKMSYPKRNAERKRKSPSIRKQLSK